MSSKIYKTLPVFLFTMILTILCLACAVYGETVGTANGTNINVRVAPSLDCEIYGKLDAGQQVSVLEDADDFYRVLFDGKEDLYVYKEFLDVEVIETIKEEPAAPVSVPEAPPAGIINGDNVNIRKYPSTDHEVLAQAFKGDSFTAVSVCGNWFGIVYNGEDAYVYKDFIDVANAGALKEITVDIPDVAPSFGEDETYEMYAVVNSSSGLNLRAEPSTGSSILLVFSYGMTMDVIENLGEWTKVSIGDTVGYVASVYVDVNYGVRPVKIYTRGQEITVFARQFIGTPYVWGGASLTKGSDCSGFVYSVMKNFGVKLSRSSANQFNDGYEINKGELQPGDLVFFDTDGNGRISHVGIYIGGNEFIHSSSSRRTWGVTISSLNDDYYRRTYLRSCRVL